MGSIKCNEPLEIEVKQAKIKPETAKWIDRDTGSGNLIKKAGYGQTVCAYVDYEGLEDEQVYLDVYDDDSTGDNIVFSIQGELKGKTGMYWPFKLSDEVKKKIEAKGIYAYGDLYFKIRPLEPDLKVENGDNELAKHLRVSDKPELVNAYFTDNADKQKLKFCKQNEKLYFKVYATNYVGKKVKIHFITVSDGYYRWKGLQLQKWADIKDYFKNENFFHSVEANFNQNGEILVEVPISKLGTPKKHFLINGAIEIPAEHGGEAQGAYVEMADRAFIFKTNAQAEELKKAPAPLMVDRVSINTGEHKHEDGKCPRCEEEITEEQIKKVYGGATDENLIKEITKALNKHRNKLGLDTCARKAHFFAQSREEAGSTLEPGVIGESFNYYKYNLVKVPLKAFETEEGKRIAETYGRQNVASTPAVSEANQIILANFAYGSQHTTGKNFKNSGNDGWNFRGRGLLQITGRSNYKDIQEKIDRLVPNSGVEVYKRFDSPNRAISRADGKMLAEEAVLTGMVEWVHKDMHIIADQTGIESDNDVLNKIIDKLNKYTTSREERHKHFQKTKHIFRVDECNKLKSSKEDNGKWRFPIDNPMLCLYSEGGYEKPWHGSFGENIRDNVSNHAGVDLLAEPGTPIYACFNGVIQRVYTSTSLAGRTIVVKVTDKETFNSLKRDYDPIYKNKGEIISKGFDSNKDVFLVFMHLSKFGEYKEGDIVKYNDVIGYTGVSGKNGVNFSTYNPHLHFEINNVGSQSGINGKCNPMVYFNFKTENEMTENDKKIQLEIKNKGNIW